MKKLINENKKKINYIYKKNAIEQWNNKKTIFIRSNLGITWNFMDSKDKFVHSQNNFFRIKISQIASTLMKKIKIKKEPPKNRLERVTGRRVGTFLAYPAKDVARFSFNQLNNKNLF